MLASCLVMHPACLTIHISAISSGTMCYSWEQLLVINNCLPVITGLPSEMLGYLFINMAYIPCHQPLEAPWQRNSQQSIDYEHSLPQVPSQKQHGVNYDNLIEIQHSKYDYSFCIAKLNIALINATAIMKKATALADYISDNDLDVTAIMES